MAYIWITQIILICGLVAIRPTTAEMCSPLADNPSPKQVVGKFGQSLSIIAEKQGDALLSIWKRQIIGPDNSVVPLTLVSYSNGKNLWADNSTVRPYSATWNPDAGKSTYTLQFTKLTCYERGEFSCHFLGQSGECVTKFNVNITAEPLAPVLKNETIRGDAGSTVNVMCEANVGYPAGEIWWYYMPDDGTNAYRLQNNPANLSSAGDCRSYAKSTIAIQLKAEDNNSKIRCTTRSGTGKTGDNVEAKIIINGMEPAETSPTPKSCTGNKCATTGAVAITVSILPSMLALFLHVLITFAFMKS